MISTILDKLKLKSKKILLIWISIKSLRENGRSFGHS